MPPATAPALTHITATQIAQLGAFRHGMSERQRQLSGRRFRVGVLGDLPPDAGVALSDGNRATPAVIGQIVHELLRYGNFALDKPGSDDMIRSVAWEKGLTNPQLAAPVQQEVRSLLERYADSDVCRWIRSARQHGRAVHTELAFLFRTGKRVIHGVMDVLLEGQDGEWLVIDYKTSHVIGAAYEAHARRYYMQLGVYAAAAQNKLGLPRPPQTCVHYIRGNRTVKLASEDCLAELAALEASIGALAALDD